MSIRTHCLRAGKYLRRHGLKSSMKRIWREVQNRILYNREILYCQNLLHGEFECQAMPENFRIERYDERSEVPERLLKRIAEHYSEELMQDHIRKRFEKGARLWWLMNDTEDIGYTWTLEGRATEPYYFPLMKGDVYFFDALIFPSLRGRGLNSILLNHILKHYKSEGYHRAFLETAEWNTAVMKFMLKNDFVRIGLARKRFRRGKCKVTWWY